MNDIVTSLLKTRLTAEGREVILYMTVSGKIGILKPLGEDDAYFFLNLEQNMLMKSLSPISSLPIMNTNVLSRFNSVCSRLVFVIAVECDQWRLV